MNNLVQKMLFLITIVISSTNANAIILVENATISEIGSTNWNKRVFFVRLEGGDGPCSGKVVNFPEDYSQSSIAYAQSHSMAMMAFMHGYKVKLYNYGERTFNSDSICSGASFIKLSK